MSNGTRLAWRNLWRNRRRTWLTLGAMVFCNILLVFSIALQLGSYDMMIENTLSAFTGHLQVQRAGYLDNPKMRSSIADVGGLAESLRVELASDAVAARATAFALASSEERSFGIQITGVEPDFEPGVSILPGLVRRGHYLSGSEDAEVVIGAVLARNLRVDVGDELTFIGSGHDGSLAAGVVIIRGIFESGMTELDRGVVQMPLGYFQSVFAMQGRGHGVVMVAPNLDRVENWRRQVDTLVGADDELVVLDWDQLLPGLRQATRADMTSAWFMYSVLVLLVCFSVLNTQLMSVLERTHEFGVMLALGLRPWRLTSLVIRESVLMGILGLLLGCALGALVVLYFEEVGLYFDGMDEMNARFNMPERMYPALSWLALLWGPVTVFVGSVLATFYPALRLLRMQPVQAMRAV